IYDKLAAFAAFGFPESHSVSFAYLVYASSWLKRYHPAAFCAALLGAQPMGFYSPHTLVQDARRHGVVVHTPDVNASGALATLEGPAGAPQPAGAPPSTWGHGGPEVRLGRGSVRGIGTERAEAVVAERDAHGPFRSLEDLVRRTALPATALEALATAGAFGCFGLDRRAGLWAAGAVAAARDDRLEGLVTGVEAPRLPGMDDHEEAVADLWATGVAPDGHPTRFLRDRLDALGVVVAADLASIDHGTRVVVAGV